MNKERITDVGYDQEDAYFHQKDLDLIAKRRAELDARRERSASTNMKCPRCGSDMTEVVFERVKIDRCTACRGIFLDKGELEILTRARPLRFLGGLLWE
jgi:hypothetical protein